MADILQPALQAAVTSPRKGVDLQRDRVADGDAAGLGRADGNLGDQRHIGRHQHHHRLALGHQRAEAALGHRQHDAGTRGAQVGQAGQPGGLGQLFVNLGQSRGQIGQRLGHLAALVDVKGQQRGPGLRLSLGQIVQPRQMLVNGGLGVNHGQARRQRRPFDPQRVAVGLRQRAIQPRQKLARHHHVARLDQQIAQGRAAHRLQDDRRRVGGQPPGGGDHVIDPHHGGNRHQCHHQPRPQHRPQSQQERRRFLDQPVEIGLKRQRPGGDRLRALPHARCSVCCCHRWR